MEWILVQQQKQQGFDDVATTVRALATTDKRIVEYLRAISEGDTPQLEELQLME